MNIHERACVLQVKIFEEDFQKERRDRERMNEEKEDLRRQVERLQGQMTNLTNQVSRITRLVILVNVRRVVSSQMEL